MAVTVVVGGHSRNIGKTSVMAAIISGTSELGWTALKITQYGHGICSTNGKSCHCSTDDHRVAIMRESNPSARTDTSRFLSAGAEASYWVRTKQGMLFEAMDFIRNLLDEQTYVIVESNSILRFLQPDVYLQVLDFGVADFKSSSLRYLDRVNAFVLTSDTGRDPEWPEGAISIVRRKPVFRVSPPSYMTPEILDYIRNSIPCPAKQQS